jgi:hypothetical protein
VKDERSRKGGRAEKENKTEKTRAETSKRKKMIKKRPKEWNFF